LIKKTQDTLDFQKDESIDVIFLKSRLPYQWQYGSLYSLLSRK